jgi:hypothetical protein
MRLLCHPVRVWSAMTTDWRQTKMPFTNADNLLRCFQRATESIVAEHHPDDNGMPYVIRFLGGKHNGVEIHCATERSTIALFDEFVCARKGNYEHPFLVAV